METCIDAVLARSDPRPRYDQGVLRSICRPARAYVERRTNEGLTKREIIRCLKRYIAREIYANLPRPQNDSLNQDAQPQAA